MTFRFNKTSLHFVPWHVFACILFVLSMTMGGSSVFAQLGGGSIEGTITDQNNAVISGATVTATNIATNTAVSRTSTSTGYYVLAPLNAGNYTVTVMAKGFQSHSQENVIVNALETRTINVAVHVGEQTETITVTAAPPQLNTENASIESTMENEVYSALPIAMNGQQKTATQFAYLMPGVQSNLTSGNTGYNSGIFNGSGSRGEVAEMYVDGVAVSYAGDQGDPRTVWSAIPFDAVEQFQVMTSTYPIDMQGQGVENYVIKSGSNHIHGSAFENLRNTSLDTWNFFSKAAINPLTGKATKPVENQNEYGITIGGPVLKNKVFLFGSYDGYRYKQGVNPSYVTIPTVAQRGGDFTASGLQSIYDPTSTFCTSAVCTRTQYQGTLNGVTTKNVIPSSMISPITQKIIATLPSPTNAALTNNYLGGSSNGLSNWTSADRIDADLSSRQHITVMFSAGRQSTVGNTSATLPLPYNSSFSFAPKTKTIVAEHDYTISQNMLNQLKYGFARYYAPAFDPQYGVSDWEAANYGITNLPVGEASQSFPKVSFSGTNAPSSWGTTGHYVVTYNTYTLVDNLQWTKGRHSITAGAQVQWLQVNYLHSAGGSAPMSLAFSTAQTGQYQSRSTTIDSTTGAAFASFLVGALNSSGFTQYAVNTTGLRYRPFSPYVQDNLRINSKLSLNVGLRYDLFPPMHEVNDVMSFMNPTITNPATGNLGILEFAGNGTDSCQCHTPAHYYKGNFGPRLGFSYSVNSKTVIHGAWGIMFTHGGGTGGATNGPAYLGYYASPSASSKQSGFPAFYVNNSTGYTNLGLANAAFPAYTAAPFFSPSYGTYYSTAISTPSAAMTYIDPRLGGRSPEYVNWNFGVQRQVTNNLNVGVVYVGSEGHFESIQSNNARGYWANELNPKYLALGSLLTSQATASNIAAGNAIMPNLSLPYSTFSGTIGQMLLPFPQFSGVSDAFGVVGNSNFHALEIQIKQRATKGLTFNANYTLSKSIDNGGTYRSGYLSSRVERSISAANQPNNFNASFVYNMPFGKGAFTIPVHSVNYIVRDWDLSGIVLYSTGSPLAIIATGCTIYGQGTCMPNLNSSFSGSPRIHGKWGHGVTASNVSTSFIDAKAFTLPAAYTIGTAPRVAAYNLYGPSNKNVDISLRRRFAIYQQSKLLVQGDVYNLFNNVVFGGIGTTFGSATFGQVTSQANNSRDIQVSAKIEF